MKLSKWILPITAALLLAGCGSKEVKEEVVQ